MDSFTAKDAILEPGIIKSFEQLVQIGIFSMLAYYQFDFCVRFLDFGGSKKMGVAALADSYAGLPNMVNVMIEWLHAAGYRKREIQGLVDGHVKSLILQHFDPTKADLIFTEEGSVRIFWVHFQ